ncbi:MAG: hypothetical protein IPK16_28960 [Anaerolineales bacterium]|nr:hypothetical protein [Anaerolineales bacterium]
MVVIGSRVSNTPVDQVDRMFPASQLEAMLPLADVVVMVAPHTPSTEQLFGQSAFAAMKEGAFFINIGRGASVDEAALLEALVSGKLAGAALDVFAKEPLPVDSPFWDMPQVMVSPHSASTSDKENQRITDLFCDNLRRYLNQEPLRNVLDVERLAARKIHRGIGPC